MILIDRQGSKMIEYHFINFENDLIAVEELTAEVAERYNFAIEATGVKSGNNVGDEKMIGQIEEIQRTTDKLRRWIKVVQETKEHFKNIIHDDFIKLYYEKRRTISEIANELYVSPDSVYKYRQDVINYAAAKADKVGLIKL